jgi:hypothetical protein
MTAGNLRITFSSDPLGRDLGELPDTGGMPRTGSLPRTGNLPWTLPWRGDEGGAR